MISHLSMSENGPASLKDWGMWINSIGSQPNTSEAVFCTEEGFVICKSDEQPTNSLLPIDVTELPVKKQSSKKYNLWMRSFWLMKQNHWILLDLYFYHFEMLCHFLDCHCRYSQWLKHPHYLLGHSSLFQVSLCSFSIIKHEWLFLLLQIFTHFFIKFFKSCYLSHQWFFLFFAFSQFLFNLFRFLNQPFSRIILVRNYVNVYTNNIFQNARFFTIDVWQISEFVKNFFKFDLFSELFDQ